MKQQGHNFDGLHKMMTDFANGLKDVAKLNEEKIKLMLENMTPEQRVEYGRLIVEGKGEVADKLKDFNDVLNQLNTKIKNS